MCVDPHVQNENGEQAYYWREKGTMIFHDGHWKEKIDFVMDVLGPETVTRELKELVKGRRFSELMAAPDFVPRYRAKLEELCSLAKDQFGA
jgi:hypothetical protein